MAEPRQRDAAVCRLVVGQLANHLRLRSRMAQHVDEVEHHHVQVVPLQFVQLTHQSVGLLRRVDLMV